MIGCEVALDWDIQLIWRNMIVLITFGELWKIVLEEISI